MRDILGDVLGKNFKGVTLKSYNKALKNVEDKEDYETGKQTLKDTEANYQGEDGEAENDEDASPADQIVEIDKIVNALPPIIIYGLKMIEGYSGNFDAFREEEEADDEKGSKGSDDDSKGSDDVVGDDNDFEMKPPRPVDRNMALAIIKDEKARLQNLYGFA